MGKENEERMKREKKDKEWKRRKGKRERERERRWKERRKRERMKVENIVCRRKKEGNKKEIENKVGVMIKFGWKVKDLQNRREYKTEIDKDRLK